MVLVISGNVYPRSDLFLCTVVVGWLDPLGIWTPLSDRDIVEVGFGV